MDRITVGKLLTILTMVSLTVAQKQLSVPAKVTQHRNIIPVSILKEMSKINSTSDFVKKFLTRDTQGASDKNHEDVLPGTDESVGTDSNLTKKFEQDVFTGEGSIDDEGAVVAEEFIGKPSLGCKPKLKAVPLPRNGKSSVVYWPDCITLDQCVGCCTSDLLECRPVSTSTYEINAIVMEYNWTTSSFMYRGVSKFDMLHHQDCECQCKIQRFHCNPTKHKYEEDECRCRCMNDNKASTCTSLQKWDENQCECVCQKDLTCPPNEYFHTGSCSCVKREGEEDSDTEPDRCAGTLCRARSAAVWRDGQCECVSSDEWGDVQKPGSIDVYEAEEAVISSTTQRPLVRPRPPSRRRAMGERRPRARKDTAVARDELTVN